MSNFANGGRSRKLASLVRDRNIKQHHNQSERNIFIRNARKCARIRISTFVFCISTICTHTFLTNLYYDYHHTPEITSKSWERYDEQKNLVQKFESSGEAKELNDTLTIEKVYEERDQSKGIKPITIAYAVSITSCGKDDISNLVDGAAVLKHSIHINSIDNHKQNNKESQFSYQMIAFIHPEAINCQSHMEQLGYIVSIQETPVDVTKIKGDFYREHVVKSGCCGDREFLKLYAYTLMDYPIVVHLDIDCLILKPLDDLFLVMLKNNVNSDEYKSYGDPNLRNVHVMYEKPIYDTVNAFFTRDYNMVRPGKKYPGVQGGFLIVRPSIEAFEEYKKIILEGNFKQGTGWGGLGFGGYYGAQQIQGIASYFYDHLHPGTAVELNRCVYNSMADNPRSSETDGSKCRDGRELCEDCRGRPMDDIRSIHFTLCQKPWLCTHFDENGKYSTTGKMCNKFHHEWHRVRSDLEAWLELDNVKSSGNHKAAHFYGHCNHAGKRGYIPLF